MKLELTMLKKFTEYGLIMGRFQPFHLGHQAIVNEVLLDGKIPIILVGSTNKTGTSKNPLSFNQVKKCIKLIYPNDKIIIKGIEDNTDDIWMQGIYDILENITDLKKVTFYYHNKKNDFYNFYYKGRSFSNKKLNFIFEHDNLISTKELRFPELDNFEINCHATDIRNDIEGFKHFLDARVYWFLKS